MPRLLSQFVQHYTAKSAAGRLRRSIDDSWKGIKRDNEVNALRSYLMDPGVGIDYLNNKVAAAVSGPAFQLKFAGVFCHKKPTIQRSASAIAVNPGDTPGCELGDLLTLFVLFDANNDLHYMAGSLFQAKRYAQMTSRSQQHLYDDDDDFILPSYLGGHTRRMPTIAEGRGRALRYLILNPDRPNSYVSCRHSPWTATYQPRWSTYIDGLLGATDGLSAQVDPTSKLSSWDQIVRDLLQVAKSVPAKKPPRGTNVAVQVATGLFNNFSNYESWSVEANAPGVSVMMAIAYAHQGRG